MSTSEQETNKLLSKLPSVSDLLESPQLRALVDRVSHNVVVDGARNFLGDLRNQLISRAADVPVPPLKDLADRIADYIVSGEQTTLCPVINATGILLHTGLGRAPLADAAVHALAAVAGEYSSVELDLESGERSRRTDEVERLLCQLTGAEAALVVNNNAAATLLTLAALAEGKEVVVSRGQLVEIGGSFRLPEIMAASGAQLKEVGTTNKTRAEDYKSAIGDDTAAILRVHWSNFRIVGFTASASLNELVSLSRAHNIPLIDDVGSGALKDMSHLGLKDEPVVVQSIRSGADVVLFSGDKLLSGPQAGVILGKRSLVKRIAAHPLARAVRVDKLTLAPLAATLRLWRDVEKATDEIPLLRLLATPLANLQQRAERLADRLQGASGIASAESIESTGYLGGGSVPQESIPSWVVAIAASDVSTRSFAQQLRVGTPSVVGRIHEDRLWLELRTVFPRQDDLLLDAIKSAASQSSSQSVDSAGVDSQS